MISPSSRLAFRPVRIAFAASLALAGVAAQAQAQPDNTWHGAESIGGAWSTGNASSKTLSATTDLWRASATDKISLFGNANFGRSTVGGVNTTTADQFRMGGRYDYNLGDSLFAFGGLAAETNKVAGLQSRVGLDTGLGYKLLRSADTSVDLFGGVGYGKVRFTDGTRGNGATLLFGEESSHKLSSSVSFKQRFEFRPGQSELGNTATFDAGLSTALSGGWTLNTGLSSRYASKVPVGLKNTDTLLTMGFGYKF